MSFLSARKKSGLSQAAVGAALGVAAAAVSQWETGETSPKTKRLPEIAKLYGCTTDELLAEDGDGAQEVTSLKKGG